MNLKKLSQILATILLCTNSLSAQILPTFNYQVEGQRVCLVDVSINMNPISATLHFLDSDLNTGDLTSVYRRALYGSGDDWLLQVSDLSPGTDSWTDTNVNTGEVWEYQIKRTHANGYALGYVCAAVYYDQSDYKGQMILVIAEDVPIALPDEILRLKKDLTGDGWYVNELEVAVGAFDFEEGDAVVEIKNSITDIYNNAPDDDKPKVLYVLGHVPLPRSGQDLQPPDGHIEATGARGSDVYYADIDGVFTDTATFDIPQQTFVITKNYPNDYKWDQDLIPSELEMAFGRVNFLRVNDGNPSTEMNMMQNYLNRSHSYRHVSDGQKIGLKTGMNETGYSNSTEAGYRCLPAISGGDSVLYSSLSVENGHNQWVKDNGPLLWYMSNQHVPFMPEWENIGMDALVYSSDQSNFGYGDIPNSGSQSGWQGSAIRRIIGYDTKCLMAIWTTSAINVFHQAGVGEPLGYACKHIMDHNTTNQNYEKISQPWDSPEWYNRTHFNFFGDPTLKLYQTFPITDLTVTDIDTEFRLQWTASIDEHLVGYHVYKSETEFGIYQKLTSSSPIIDTTFVDPSYQTGDWYMVRAIAEQRTGSGIFLHPSQGLFVEGEIVLSAHQSAAEKQINIFPNPTNDFLYIEHKVMIENLELFSSNGQLLYSSDRVTQNPIRIDLSVFPENLYLVKLKDVNGVETIHEVVKSDRK